MNDIAMPRTLEFEPRSNSDNDAVNDDHDDADADADADDDDDDDDDDDASTLSNTGNKYFTLKHTNTAKLENNQDIEGKNKNNNNIQV